MVAGCLPAGTAEGDGVLRVLNDPVQFLTHSQLQALIRASAASGAGQLLVGDDVTFFKAVSVATERLGVQQSSNGDAWIHTDREAMGEAGVTRAAGCTPEENRTAALTLTQPKVQLGRPTSRLCESLKHTVHFLIHTVIPRGNHQRRRAEGADFSPQQTCQIRQSAQQSEVSVSTHMDTARANKGDPKWKRAETGRLTSARRSESYLMSAVLK